MIAQVEKIESGCLARYERDFTHTQEEIWSYLTVNEKLAQWFPELRISQLEKGQKILFDSQDGIHEELEILDLKNKKLLEFTWGEDVVRFEVYPKPHGCQLVLIEKVRTISKQTSKDLAGWHVCLDRIKAIVTNSTMENRNKVWDKWYDLYQDILNKLN